MSLVLRAQNLSKTFEGPPRLELFSQLSLDLYSGRSVAIVGKSGSGKSTLLHILGTLDEPSSGELFICGKKAKSARQELRSKHIGFVFQSFHLLEDYSLLENLLMPALIAKKPTGPKSVAYTQAENMLKFVDLYDKRHMRAKILSGGEKQRAALARAFSNDPDILLVDEPTGNLDPTSAETVQKLLLGGCKELGKALVLVTHDYELARLCDTVYQLKQGKLCPL